MHSLLSLMIIRLDLGIWEAEGSFRCCSCLVVLLSPARWAWDQLSSRTNVLNTWRSDQFHRPTMPSALEGKKRLCTSQGLELWMPESFPDVFCLSADFSCRSFDKQPYILYPWKHSHTWDWRYSHERDFVLGRFKTRPASWRRIDGVNRTENTYQPLSLLLIDWND